MTYKELLEALKGFTPTQLESDATIFCSQEGEFYPISEISFTGAETDVLDENHPILEVNF